MLKWHKDMISRTMCLNIHACIIANSMQGCGGAGVCSAVRWAEVVYITNRQKYSEYMHKQDLSG